MNPNPPLQWCVSGVLGEPAFQSDFFDWCEAGMGLDANLSGGVPIPRGPVNRVPQQHHHFTGVLSSRNYQMDDHSPRNYQMDDHSQSSSLPTQQLDNMSNYWENNLLKSESNNLSNNTQTHHDNYNNSLSPHSPSLWPHNSMDLDLDIKLEPFDDILGVDNLIHDQTLGLNTHDDDTLLDDVNLDYLLASDKFNNTGMEHSNSPLPMMTVHPDEILGGNRGGGYSTPTPTSSGYFSSPSMTQPVKAESSSLYSLLASSFPPQGGGWRDPLLTSSSLPGQQQIPEMNNHLGSIEECPGSTNQLQTLNQPHQHQQQQNHSSGSSTSALQELLLRGSPSTPLTPLSPQSVASPLGATPSPQEPMMGQSVPRHTSITAANPILTSRLSSSAPSRNFSFEQAWQRREPRQHLLSTGSLAEEYGGSASSLSTVGGILSPVSHDLSIDESVDLDSDDESDNEQYESESDNESVQSEDTGSISGSSKKERYFWQYNVQAKGPKGQRVSIKQQTKDPHNLASVMDPVFSPLCSIQGIKHSGKARRGDGNDLTPNPRKLVSIGKELDKLNKTINDMTPVSELPFSVRPKSRKEKNKLASRACRLKKKAQHEANKIKFYGLEQEHRCIIQLLEDARSALLKKVEVGRYKNTSSSSNMLQSNNVQIQGSSPEGNQAQQALMSHNIEKITKIKNKHRIAGQTTDFVNKVIESCQNGNSTGGLEELTRTFSDATLAASPQSANTGGYSPC